MDSSDTEIKGPPYPEYGIIGYGTVGKAIAEGFSRNGHKPWVYDKHTHPDLNWSVLVTTSVVFVAVSTPELNGLYDVTNLEDVFRMLQDEDYAGTVILVSTISVSQFRQLMTLYSLSKFKVVVSPEFLTEANAAEDFYNGVAILGKSNDLPFDASDDVAYLAMLACKAPSVDIYTDTATSCLLIKTCTNLALFMKLMTANLIFKEAMDAGLPAEDAQEVVDTVFSDRRLNTDVPYHTVGNCEGGLGIGGKCLPKDVAAKISNADPYVSSAIQGLVNLNKQLRLKAYPCP